MDMVKFYGFNRDMGHDQMTDIDKEYREFVEQDIHYINDNVYFLTNDIYEPIHHHTWLQLMGLIETWDIV